MKSLLGLAMGALIVGYALVVLAFVFTLPALLVWAGTAGIVAGGVGIAEHVIRITRESEKRNRYI